MINARLWNFLAINLQSNEPKVFEINKNENKAMLEIFSTLNLMIPKKFLSLTSLSQIMQEY